MGQIPFRPVARATAAGTGRDRPPSATLSTAAATMSTTPIPQVATRNRVIAPQAARDREPVRQNPSSLTDERG